TQQLTKRSIAPAQATVAAVTTPAKSVDTPVVSATPSKIDSAPATGTAPAMSATLVSETPVSEKAYDAEISRLRAIIAERLSTLDPATTASIDRNLKIIDDAIAQCRMALRKDPASRFLMQSLDDALTTKIQLLRRAASLPSRA